MGFTIANYTLMGIPLQNVYVSIKGRFSIVNSSFMYNVMMTKKYQMYADYWFSLGKGMPTIQSNSITVDLDDIPANMYASIYENIKAQLDPGYALKLEDATPEQSLFFTDD
jgi:uncharacterized membrane protein YukC